MIFTELHFPAPIITPLPVGPSCERLQETCWDPISDTVPLLFPTLRGSQRPENEGRTPEAHRRLTLSVACRHKTEPGLPQCPRPGRMSKSLQQPAAPLQPAPAPPHTGAQTLVPAHERLAGRDTWAWAAGTRARVQRWGLEGLGGDGRGGPRSRAFT